MRRWTGICAVAGHCHRQYTTGAIGIPGCPELACCTASMDNVRIVLMHNWSWLTDATFWAIPNSIGASFWASALP